MTETAKIRQLRAGANGITATFSNAAFICHRALDVWVAEQCQRVIDDEFSPCPPFTIRAESVDGVDFEFVDESKFVKGDHVIISDESRFYSDSENDGHNPGIRVGEVMEVNTDTDALLGICVRWDNGIHNSYTEKDLDHLTDEHEAMYNMIGERVVSIRKGTANQKGTVVGFGIQTNQLLVDLDDYGSHEGNGFRRVLGKEYDLDKVRSELSWHSQDELVFESETMTHGVGDHVHTIRVDAGSFFVRDAGIGIDTRKRRMIFSPTQVSAAARFLSMNGLVSKTASEYEEHIYNRMAQCYRGDWENGFVSALGYTIEVDSTDDLDYDGYLTMQFKVSVNPAIGDDEEYFQGDVDSEGQVVVKFPQQ